MKDSISKIHGFSIKIILRIVFIGLYKYYLVFMWDSWPDDQISIFLEISIIQLIKIVFK